MLGGRGRGWCPWEMQRKRPCCVCRRWFSPDPRVGSRQRVCGEAACKEARERQRQAEWRRKNPEYFTRWRMEERGGRERPPDPLRMRAPLSGLPWDLAQTEFGVQGADFIGHLGRLLLGGGKTQMVGYRVELKGKTDRVGGGVAKTEMATGADSRGHDGDPGVAPAGPALRAPP